MGKTLIYCPLCGSKNINHIENNIKCFDCNKTADNRVIELINQVEEIISNEKRNDLQEYILNAPDLPSFKERLLEIKNRNWNCPYCGKKIDIECKICPACGVFLTNKGLT